MFLLIYMYIPFCIWISFRSNDSFNFYSVRMIHRIESNWRCGLCWFVCWCEYCVSVPCERRDERIAMSNRQKGQYIVALWILDIFQRHLTIKDSLCAGRVCSRMAYAHIQSITESIFERNGIERKRPKNISRELIEWWMCCASINAKDIEIPSEKNETKSNAPCFVWLWRAEEMVYFEKLASAFVIIILIFRSIQAFFVSER